MCVWICTVKGAKLFIVVTLGSRRRRYFQLLLFPFLFFFFFFSTSIYYLCSLKQKHKSLPGSFPTPLKPVSQGPRSPTTRLDQVWDSAGPKHYGSPGSLISFHTNPAELGLREEGGLWNKTELGLNSCSACWNS